MLGLQQTFDRLPNGATTTRTGRGPRRGGQNRRRGIRHRDRKAASGEHREIRNVVADHGDLRPLETEFGQHRLDGRNLVSGGGREAIHPKFPKAMPHRGARSAGHRGDLAARLDPPADAKTVADVEPLELAAAIVDPESAVGQNAVDIETDQSDAPGRLEGIALGLCGRMG